MKQVIPFYKEIVFKTNIASITSISLEHEEKINNGEVNGEFIILGDYKVHNDTTERELFKYKLPFTAIIPDDVDVNTIVLDIENFTYEQIESDVLRVNIDFSIQGEVIEVVEDKVYEEIVEDRNVDEKTIDSDKLDYEIEQEIEDILSNEVTIVEDKKNDTIISDNKVEIEDNVINNDSNNNDEYVTYHIHIVKDNENIDNIVKQYNTNIDYIKEYNEITNINVGDKVIIPEYGEE